MAKDTKNKHYFMPGEFIVMVVYKPEAIEEIEEIEEKDKGWFRFAPAIG